MKSLWRAEAIW